MDNKELEEELRRRYNYLFENKELILAMCIERRKDKESARKKYMSVKRMIKDVNDPHIKELLSNINSKNKKRLEDEEFYLLANVKDEIINSFEEFLLGDKKVEETALYKHVEALKESNYLDAINYMISELEERRSRNLHLKNIPAFTVWKILTYVRRKYPDNTTVKSALDKYYNIDRYVINKHDCEYGYNIPSSEIDEHTTIVYPSTTISSLYKGTGIISFYRFNQYEVEDDYFHNSEADEDNRQQEEYDSIFANKLRQMPMPSKELKESIAKENNKTYYTRVKKY